MKAGQENTIQELSTDERPAEASYRKSKDSQDHSARIVQILQKQSLQLDRISKALEKHQQMAQQLKSSMSDMEKRMRAAEKKTRRCLNG